MKISQKIFDLCLILEDKKAQDITVCNTTALKKPVDFFVLATATSVSHAKGIADYLIETVQKDNLFEVSDREGLVTSDWVVVDLGDGFVHIFTKEVREKYNLEKLLNEGNNTRSFDKIKKDFEKEKKNNQTALKKAEKKEKKSIEKAIKTKKQSIQNSISNKEKSKKETIKKEKVKKIQNKKEKVKTK